MLDERLAGEVDGVVGGFEIAGIPWIGDVGHLAVYDVTVYPLAVYPLL